MVASCGRPAPRKVASFVPILAPGDGWISAVPSGQSGYFPPALWKSPRAVAGGYGHKPRTMPAAGRPRRAIAVTDVEVATALTSVRSEREKSASAGYSAAPLQFRRRILVITARTPIRAVLADALLRHRNGRSSRAGSCPGASWKLREALQRRRGHAVHHRRNSVDPYGCSDS